MLSFFSLGHNTKKHDISYEREFITMSTEGAINQNQEFIPTMEPNWNQRIFVNRTLRMDQIQVVGFDMDYTLIIYKQAEMEKLSLRCTLEKMIRCGYSEEILSLPYDPKFSIRGLVIDTQQGNVLKMDRYGYVELAYHGTNLLSKEERFKHYREQHIRPTANRYTWIDTLYSLPEAVIYATLVDFIDKKNPIDQKIEKYQDLWRDIRNCLDESHKDGSIKNEIIKNPAYYVEVDSKLPTTLHRLKSAGKKLFLLTNSPWEFTDRMMSFLLNQKIATYNTWRYFFDAVVVEAHKPEFFKDKNPLYELDEQGKIYRIVGNEEKLDKGKIYQRGNIHDFQTQIGGYADKVLYIGDHIYGDVLRAKKTSSWRTAMIIQELEAELSLLYNLQTELNRLEQLERKRIRTDSELYYQRFLQQRIKDVPTIQVEKEMEIKRDLQKLRRKIEGLERIEKKIHLEMDELSKKIQISFNPWFGPIFKASAENSLFAEQVETYACLYTSRVSNFMSYSPFQYFRSPREHLPHERVY